MLVVGLKSVDLGERLPKGLVQALRCGKGKCEDGWKRRVVGGKDTAREGSVGGKLDDLVGLA